MIAYSDESCGSTTSRHKFSESDSSSSVAEVILISIPLLSLGSFSFTDGLSAPLVQPRPVLRARKQKSFKIYVTFSLLRNKGPPPLHSRRQNPRLSNSSVLS